MRSSLTGEDEMELPDIFQQSFFKEMFIVGNVAIKWLCNINKVTAICVITIANNTGNLFASLFLLILLMNV